MSRRMKRTEPQAVEIGPIFAIELGIDAELAPITAMMSSRLMVLANLLRRGAILRYKRLAGLSSVEVGLVGSLGRRPPLSVGRVGGGGGNGKGQVSRGVARVGGGAPGWQAAP